MATSSTIPTTVYISPRLLKTTTPFSYSFGFTTKNPRPRFYIRNCTSAATDAQVEASSSTATETESEEAPIEVSKGPPSLISAANVDKALRGLAITDVDHYGILGVQRRCSNDQVRDAYKKRLEEVKGEGLDEVEINKKVELLKESYSILSTAEERRMYDWSLGRSDKPDRYAWPFEVDNTKTSTESPPPQEAEDVVPTRLVGYFILGWMILAFTLSIALNG